MKDEELITLIEAEWDLDNGFFGKLRSGSFDRTAYMRCKQSLEYIRQEVGESEVISRRLVSLMWYIPLFMTWQTDRVDGTIDSQQYSDISNEILSILEQILLVP